MKKLFFFLMSATFVCTGFAATCVSVKQVSTNYTNHQLTIAITRTGCNDATTNRSTVWVFVDYRTVNANGTKGAWTRATISATNAGSAGTVVNSGNSKGAWIYAANGTQTVMLTLSGMPANTRYDWCAFATDYPPNVGAFNNNIYTLRGTPPFTINGNVTVNSKTHTGVAITSITDATGCPGIVCGGIKNEPVGATGCCLPGLTLVGGGTYGSGTNTYTTPAVCRDLYENGTSPNINCGVQMESICRHPTTWACPCPSGWRCPEKKWLIAMLAEGVITYHNSFGYDISLCRGGDLYYTLDGNPSALRRTGLNNLWDVASWGGEGMTRCVR